MDTREYWKKRYSQLSDASKREYLDEYYEGKIMADLAANSEYFKIFGPSNLKPAVFI